MTGIIAVGWQLPNELIPLHEVAERTGAPLKQLQKMDCISRGQPGDDDHPSTLAAKATQSALDAAGMSIDDIDLLFFCGVTRDRPAPWIAATGVLSELGATRTHGIDLAARCAGVGDSLWMARHLIEAGAYRRIVVCTGDRFDYLMPEGGAAARRPICALHGAAGSAAIVGPEAENRIVAHASHTSGEQITRHRAQTPRAGGSRRPFSPEAFAAGEHEVAWELAITEEASDREFSRTATQRTVQEVCARAELEEGDFISGPLVLSFEHQRWLAEVGFPPEKTFPLSRTYGFLGPSITLASVGAAIASGQAVGPRLVLCTRAHVYACSVAIRGTAPDLGIRAQGSKVVTA